MKREGSYGVLPLSPRYLVALYAWVACCLW